MLVLYHFAERSGFTPSENDYIYDLSESSLKFMLLPYAIGGEIIYRCMQFDINLKSDHLEKAQSYFESFTSLLRRCLRV